MKISGTAGVAGALIVLAAVGGGTFFFKTVQRTRQLELEQQIQTAKHKARSAAAAAAESEEKAKEAEARKAEAERRKAEALAEAKQADLATRKQEALNLKEKIALAAAEAKRASAVQAAAAAETAKSAAAKAAAEARRLEQEKRAAAETIARERAHADQKKAEAARDEKMAVKQIADAARAKSENERKTAEANAAAERDRKLRLYSRANTSRAEMLALRRAEKLLALEEAGALDAAEDAADVDEEAGKSAADRAAAGETNVVVPVTWPAARSDETPAGRDVAARQQRLEERIAQARTRRVRRHIREFGALVDKAIADGRAADARYYRSTLISLVPDYVAVYEILIDEARKAGDAKAEGRLLDELIALVPGWQRVAVCVDLIQRDEAYYSRVLAGRVEKDEYVKAFRKIYDEARRDKGDRDARDAKIARLCKVLAAYVPDFENSPEWK